MFPLVAPLNHLIICAAPNMNFFAPNKNFFAPNTNVFAPNINFLSTAIIRDPVLIHAVKLAFQKLGKLNFYVPLKWLSSEV